MRDRPGRPPLRFPAPTRVVDDGSFDGALPNPVPDEALLRDLADWTVPPASEESRERLLTSASAGLETRRRMASRFDRLRLAAPESPRRRWPLAAAAATLAVAVAGSFWFGAVSVSAREALSRAEEAEARQWATTARPVVHQRLELRAIGGGTPELVHWESWSNPTGPTRRVVVDEPHHRSIVTRYLDALARNGLAEGPPLSAVALARWPDLVSGRASTRVERPSTDARSALRIHVHVAGPQTPGRIVRTTVLLRTSDWHLVEQVIDVQTDDGRLERFELIEHGVASVSRDLLSAGFFDDEVKDAKVPETAPAAVATVSAATLREVEIQALFALHQLRADLGEQVDLVRRAHAIEVRGVVDDADRLAAIAGVLSQIPHVQLSLIRADHVGARRLGRQPGPDRVSPSTSGPPAIGADVQPPLWRFIEAYLRSGEPNTPAIDGSEHVRAVNVFVQEMTGEAEAAVAPAWALRRLAERYPPETRGELPESSRRRLQEMTHDHFTAIQTHVARLKRGLEPIVVTAQKRHVEDGAQVAESPIGESRSNPSSGRVFLDVLAVEREIARLLLSPDSDRAPAEQHDESVLRSLEQVLSSLTRLDRELQLLIGQA